MSRTSTRPSYQDRRILSGHAFGANLKPQDRDLFKDWVNGMNGRELAQKYHMTEIYVRQRLAVAKLVYNTIQYIKTHEEDAI